MLKSYSRTSYGVLATLIASFYAGPAAMADPDPVTEPALETVVVTAQMRAQDPIDVPFALSAYSGHFMEEEGIQEMDKLSLFVPGFEVQSQSPNNPGFVMRGITSDSGDPTQEPRVAVFEDGVSISATRGSYIELFDIERVETAKGPQTTLFGRGALIGGVNIIQNKAKIGEFSIHGEVEAGNYDYRMIGGAVNIPVTDDLAIRIAGRYKSRTGDVKNLNDGVDYNSVNTGAARLSVGWEPSDRFRADFIFNFEEDSPSGTAFKSGAFAPADADTGTVLGDTSPYSGAALTDSVDGFEDNKRLGLDRTVWDAKAITQTKLDKDFTLTTTTAYRRFDSEEVFDPDGFAMPIMQAAEDERSDQFSHEMRLNWDNGGRISAFGGVSYFYNNTSQRVPFQFDEYGMLGLYTWGNSSAYKSTMASLLQNSSVSGMDSAMSSFATSYLTSQLYSSYYSAYYSALAGTYGDTIASAYADSYATSLSSTYGAALADTLKDNHWEQYTVYGKTKALDLYGDVTVHVTDLLEFDAGLRYTHEDKQSGFASKIGDRSALGIIMNGDLSGILTDSSELAKLLTSTDVDPDDLDSLLDYGLEVQPTANNGDKITKDYDDDSLTWRLALRYAVTDSSNVYFTYARGRRPKVLSASSPDTPYADPNFTKAPAETVDSFEVGYKVSADQDRLHFDTALYYYDYKHFQSSMLSTEGSTQTIVTFDAGKAEAYGIENSLDWQFVEWGRLFITYTYNRARFVGDSLYHGNQMRLNPDNKLSLGATFSREYRKWMVSLTPTYTWQSKIFFDDDNDIASEQDNLSPDYAVDEYQKSYGLTNLRLNLRSQEHPLSVSFFVTNLFNKHFLKDAGNTGDALGIPTFVRGEPRFFGANLTIDMK